MKVNSHKGGIAAGIIGILLLALNLAGAASTMANPTSLPRVDLATMATDGCWVIFAGFLIYLFVRSRQQKSDSAFDAPKAAPDSPEDRTLLESRRNWILAFVLIFLIIGSVNVWLLNNYLSGFTIINIEVIFDLIANLFFLYLAVQLFRNDPRAPKLLLYGVIIYAVVEAALDILRAEIWTSPATGIVTAVYFVLALTVSTSRRNFRLVHLVLLPAVIIIVLAFESLSNSRVNAIAKEQTRLGAQYSTLTQNLGGDFDAFRQNPAAAANLLPLMKNAVEQRRQVDMQIHANLTSLQQIYDKELPSIDQVQQLDYLHKLLSVLTIQQKQLDTLSELIAYAEGVDLARPTAAQNMQIASYEQQVEDEEAQIADANVTLNQP